MERDDRLRRRRERDRQRRAQESRDERDARSTTTAIYILIIIIIVFRLARCRQHDRARHATMTPEEREMARQVRRDRCPAALREPPREQQADHQTIPPHMIPHTEPQPSDHSTLEIDHPDVVQECRTFTEVYQIYRMHFMICAKNVSQQLTRMN